jgi:hypothetical protein
MYEAGHTSPRKRLAGPDHQVRTTNKGAGYPFFAQSAKKEKQQEHGSMNQLINGRRTYSSAP